MLGKDVSSSQAEVCVLCPSDKILQGREERSMATGPVCKQVPAD